MSTGMMSTAQRLAYMADQIARNFLAMGHDRAVLATADHIQSFWDPRMKERAFAMLEESDDSFTPLARAALIQVRDHMAMLQSPSTDLP